MSSDARLSDFSHVPVIDVSALVAGGEGYTLAAEAIGAACRESGFFYVVGHGVDEELSRKLETLGREFFAQDDARKMEIAMSRGGRAWRGYFPVGGELTSGRPDRKEGLYFGAELPADHPAVRAGTPLHGANLFPAIPGFSETVLRYLDAMTGLGQVLIAGISLGLENHARADAAQERWDHTSVHAFSGTYGEYLLAKVSKVFPELRNEVL